MQDHLPYWLAAAHLPGIVPRHFLQWLEHFSDIKTLFSATRDVWQSAGLEGKQLEAVMAPDWRAVEASLSWAQQGGHSLVSIEDAEYPTLLKEISDPPLVLFIRGSRSALRQPQIAMVGSRHASSYGLNNAEQFAHYLAQNGYAVTSGLARGIDAASHQGALRAKGVTLAVAGTGLSQTYPSSHRPLADAIAANGGAVISEFPLEAGPKPYHFPRRNRIIAGLSMGVLIAEAALKSGSLITARLALEQGREVFAIPGLIHHPMARGCHHLIRQGAKLVETASDIIEELGALKAMAQASFHLPAPEIPESLTGQQRLVFDQVDYVTTPIDVIILRSRLTAGEVSSILLSLELHGHVESVTGGYVRPVINQ